MNWGRIEGFSSRMVVQARPGSGRKIKCFLRDEIGCELEGGPEASIGRLHSIPVDDEALWQENIKNC